MQTLTHIDELEALYGAAVPRSLTKVRTRLTPLYRAWIDKARFVVLSSVGPEGTDASPRGEDGPVVRIADDRTLLLPDWMGNNRIDSLRNILRDGRVSLMFMVPGCNNVVRINGTAVLTADAAILAGFEKSGKRPRTVTVITLGEVYFQCAKALMRSGLWTREHEGHLLPTAGQFVKEEDQSFDGEAYDAGYAEYAKGRMW
ncbi:pyridoxamine 5'-phosphate oxidase family protein [Ruegeria sp. 2012CJ41-6]|uniref:Pyridoxamine 5'-phosphate oxidase family protein n=1 Tax=Ruegeria spongiae TaxID=2942209 RepID=A0ABT0Q675_9RHOB|nr:pyridoxamine 5'-phosphate oxidase family protein [Ruegeria spongiae]MCL6284389.1 pyridoxamine 5'-phosphate oxidase family protein [Ruegeria spongiae]